MRTDKSRATGRRQKVEMLQFMLQKIDRLEDSGKKSTAHNYRSTLNSFRRFLGSKRVYAEKMDGELMVAYEHWLMEDKPEGKGCDAITRKAGICPFDISFSYYTRGMSFVDLAHLKKKDIQGGVLTYVRRKTGKVLHIELLPEMIMIIRRYASEVKDSPYLFPLLTKDGAGYESALRLQNKRLKRVAKILGLNVKLTTHVARHSWATIARDKGVDYSYKFKINNHE